MVFNDGYAMPLFFEHMSEIKRYIETTQYSDDDGDEIEKTMTLERNSNGKYSLIRNKKI